MWELYYDEYCKECNWSDEINPEFGDTVICENPDCKCFGNHLYMGETCPCKEQV